MPKHCTRNGGKYTGDQMNFPASYLCAVGCLAFGVYLNHHLGMWTGESALFMTLGFGGGLITFLIYRLERTLRSKKE